MCKIVEDNEIIAAVTCVNGAYQLNTENYEVGRNVGSDMVMESQIVKPGIVRVRNNSFLQVVRPVLLLTAKLRKRVWYRRLGLLNSRIVNLINRGMVSGIYFNSKYYKDYISFISYTSFCWKIFVKINLN